MLHGLLAAVAAIGAGGCSTLGDGGDGGEALPNAELGPFRELRADELGASHVAPIALRDDVHQARDASILDADGEPGTAATWAYVARAVPIGKKANPEAPTDRIARHASDDGRTFEEEGREVLAPTQTWEGETLSGPCAVRAAGEIRLYYASAGSIGLATSADGITFSSRPEPVLRPFIAGSSLAAPHVVDEPGGRRRMFVTVVREGVPSSIASVGSADGIVWSSPEPLAVPRGALVGASLVSSSAIVASSPTGRQLLHVYVEARIGEEPPSIHLLSRFLDEPGWDAASSPVFAPRLGARDPEVRRITGADGKPAAMLFFSGPTSRTNDDWALGAAIAPGTAVLGPPVDRDAEGTDGASP